MSPRRWRSRARRCIGVLAEGAPATADPVRRDRRDLDRRWPGRRSRRLRRRVVGDLRPGDRRRWDPLLHPADGLRRPGGAAGRPGRLAVRGRRPPRDRRLERLARARPRVPGARHRRGSGLWRRRHPIHRRRGSDRRRSREPSSGCSMATRSRSRPCSRRLRSSDELWFSPFEEVSPPAWVKGRVVLIGDAAHATAPNMAEGASLAMEDALVLADCLAAGDDVSQALAAYVAAPGGARDPCPAHDPPPRPPPLPPSGPAARRHGRGRSRDVPRPLPTPAHAAVAPVRSLSAALRQRGQPRVAVERARARARAASAGRRRSAGSRRSGSRGCPPPSTGPGSWCWRPRTRATGRRRRSSDRPFAENWPRTRPPSRPSAASDARRGRRRHLER